MGDAEGTFNPAAFARSDTLPTLSGGPVKSSSLANAKALKPTANFPRIDYEPIYADLKDSIGLRWNTYYDAFTRFVRGELHAREFGDLTDEILYASDTTLHLHNKLICAIAFNSARDSPDAGIAVWVTAAVDKNASATTTKPTVTSDAGEQRLKKEVMAIPARDRRRLKNAILDAKPDDDQMRTSQYEDAYQASRIRVPDAVPANAAGLTKTNWELEIKKRYQQPLFVESGDLPDAANVFARMVPLCYEEAVPQGSNMQCAELVATSAEYYLKNFLGTVFDRVRSNGPKYENSHNGGIFTARFRKAVEREAELVKVGKLQRNKDDDLLPIESQTAKQHRPLTVADFKLAERVGPSLWNAYPLISFDIQNKPSENEYEEWRLEREAAPVMNGHVKPKDEDDMDLDDDDWDTDGFGERGGLNSLLDDCLAMPAA